MKKDDPQLTAFLVPKWAITGFVNKAKEIDSEAYVDKILEANNERFLVITRGYCERFIEDLHCYVDTLFEANINE